MISNAPLRPSAMPWEWNPNNGPLACHVCAKGERSKTFIAGRQTSLATCVKCVSTPRPRSELRTRLRALLSRLKRYSGRLKPGEDDERKNRCKSTLASECVARGFGEYATACIYVTDMPVASCSGHRGVTNP